MNKTKFEIASPSNLSANVTMTPRLVKRNGARGPRIREASLDDYHQIAALESKNGLDPKSHDEWTQLWVSNPVYNELRSEWPIGWVLEDDGQILGHFGNIPLLYDFNGRKLIAATGRSFVVNLSHRAYASLLAYHFFGQKNVDLYLATTVNSEAVGVLSAFGISRVPVGTWDRSACWITNYRDFAGTWLGRKVSALAKPLSYPLAAALFLKDKLSKADFLGNRSEVNVQLCANFDHRFDQFWNELKEEKSHLLLGVRTQETLDWHFRQALLKKRLWIMTVSNSSGLVAYSIFVKRDSGRSHGAEVVLADFQSHVRDAALLRPMLFKALKRCQDEGIHILENVGFSFGKSGINERAPYQYKRGAWSYFYKTREKSLADALHNPEAWEPSIFDGDASL